MAILPRRRRSRPSTVAVDVATALWISRGLWRLYRGRVPWQAARR